MKKCLIAITVALLAAFATPALAAVNPFLEVPMDHWTHDAFSQLAARGVILVGDDQPMTRFEMASVLARTLSIIDMTKASRHDAEIVRKLVVEFNDELEALGLRVDQVDMSLSRLSERLCSGWRPRGLVIVEDNNDADAYD